MLVRILRSQEEFGGVDSYLLAAFVAGSPNWPIENFADRFQAISFRRLRGMEQVNLKQRDSSLRRVPRCCVCVHAGRAYWVNDNLPVVFR